MNDDIPLLSLVLEENVLSVHILFCVRGETIGRGREIEIKGPFSSFSMKESVNYQKQLSYLLNVFQLA